jgi:hypothetical protein
MKRLENLWDAMEVKQQQLFLIEQRNVLQFEQKEEPEKKKEYNFVL